MNPDVIPYMMSLDVRVSPKKKVEKHKIEIRLRLRKSLME
jgi:hypothetical protein